MFVEEHLTIVSNHTKISQQLIKLSIGTEYFNDGHVDELETMDEDTEFKIS